ncbi:MAG: hypothetical protein KAG66_13485 [Methylococcales bacterium]|nr:hypothetical protein [Methylococcales bacterium]
MDQQEQHKREMNIGAHLAWSAAFLASGNAADSSQNLLAAAFSYYYSVFHAGFALINTDHTFHMPDMERIHHNKVESYLESSLPSQMATNAKNLRATREFLSYLGAGAPEGKLKIVRGHPVCTALGTQDIRSLVDAARKDSEELFKHLYKAVEDFCKAKSWQPLKFGREYFVDEYLDEDILLNVIPRDESGTPIIRRALKLLA